MTSPADGPGVAAAGGGRAAVVGTGLIGGSIGLALRARGWHVSGSDADPSRARRALELGALDAVGTDPHAEITFVATPVGAVAEVARGALAHGGVVTDVGGVKAPIVGEVGDPRFVGGHPMAGSEHEGVDGSTATLFEGATWVLTPTVDTDPDAYARVRAVVSSLGANVVALAPDRHDALVALVSHVPHLAAATLMRVASREADENAAVLRLAAGGFRDMTRVAAGQPGIWLDVCAENRDAIVEGLDRLLDSLAAMRTWVAAGDLHALHAALDEARHARIKLPTVVDRVEQELVEVSVPVPDRPGVLADVTTLLAELNVNVENLETVDSPEGDAGELVLVVAASAEERVCEALRRRGYRPSSRLLP
jgi:prephenate dehydrogenase